MFSSLDMLHPDPILGLMAEFRNDPNPKKVDLGVGVYKNEDGVTPIMAAVKVAEQRVAAGEETKSYIGPAGMPEFNEAAKALIFGRQHPALLAKRVETVLTPGGCGALRIGAELLTRIGPDTKIWVSDPTWANHTPLLGNAGLKIEQYPYYDSATNALKFDAMMAALEQTGAADVVLLHGCCHNPSGVDLNPDQWCAIAGLAEKKGFLPFIDLAYQGLGTGLEDDAYGVRVLAERLPELMVASSCSKNFGLYRERVGSLSLLSETSASGNIAISHVNNIVRGIYSMPPSHGGAIVAEILGDVGLRASWEEELDTMRNRINDTRRLLATRLRDRGVGKDFSFLERQKGMFSFLGISKGDIEQLKRDYSIYIVDSSRTNVVGVTPGNVDYVVDALAQVLK